MQRPLRRVPAGRASLVLVVVAATLLGCTGGPEAREGGASESTGVTPTGTAATTEATTTAPVVPVESGTSPEDQEADTEGLGEQIADLLCATSRRPTVYRAPSLYRQPAESWADPTGFFYRITVAGQTRKGFQRVQKVGCRQVTVLGAAGYGVSDSSGVRVARWVFVALEPDASVRGWVYAEDPSGAVDWSEVPVVESDVLVSSSKRLPDLRFGAYVQSYKVGEPCPMGDPNTWDLVVSNEVSGGTGPKKLNVEIAPQYRAEAEGEVVDISRSVAFAFIRVMAPGESVVLTGIPYNTRVTLDPKNRLQENDEGNNSVLLPTGEILKCEGTLD